VTGYRRPAARALTIRQPWAWATIYGGKDVENRRWATTYRGPLLIHAGRRADPGATEQLLWTMADPDRIRQPRTAWEARGAFIGVVFLADVLTDSPSRWASPGCYHWVLEFPSPIEPAIPHRGQQRLWTPPAAVVEAVAEVL
jgi:hypothetical protein